jgi:hypothetical protein
MSKVQAFPSEEEEAPVRIPEWQKKLASFLNPKLKGFTNPVPLAGAIGCSTLFIFLVLLLDAVVRCPIEKDGPMAIAPMKGIELMAHSNQFECMQAVFFMAWDPTVGMVKTTGCDPPSLQISDELTLEWCTTHTSAYEEGHPEIDGSLQDEIRTRHALPGCAGSPDNQDGDVYAFYYDKRMCRGFGEALGFALAYTTYIEVFCTLIFMIAFCVLGISVPLDDRGRRVSAKSSISSASSKIFAAAVNTEDRDDDKKLISRAEVKKMIDEALASKESGKP